MVRERDDGCGKEKKRRKGRRGKKDGEGLKKKEEAQSRRSRCILSPWGKKEKKEK